MTSDYEIPVLVVNAFTETLFGGNPAAVVITDTPLRDTTMQSIAQQHNLSETAFLVRSEGNRFHLRWFTPTKEVPLCGHATLASAFALDYLKEWSPSKADDLTGLAGDGTSLIFDTASGPLVVRRKGDQYEIDFPAVPMVEVTPPKAVVEALGVRVVNTYAPDTGAWQMVCELQSETDVLACNPDFSALSQATALGVSITAAGSDADYVSRFFIPQLGINEDPVTGSAHCQLMPFWAERLSKQSLLAQQVSARGGEISGELAGERVLLSGSCRLFSEGTIYLPSESR